MLLLDKKRLTASELARHFGTSERTVYRDIDALSLAGVPLAAEAGPGGGYSLAEGWSLDRGFLSPDEVLSLMSAVSSIQEATRDRRLASVMGKLGAISRAPSTCAGPLPPSLELSLSPWGMRPPGSEEAGVLRAAIEDRRLVRFSYESFRGPTVGREVEPYAIAIGGSTFYLHGWCRLRSAFRLFRLSRITDLSVLPRRYDPRAHGPVPSPWSAGWGGVETLRVRLRFPPSARLAVLDSFQRDEILTCVDGSLEASFSWPEADPPLRFILGFGPGVEVLEPISLRDALGEAAAAIAALNGPVQG